MLYWVIIGILIAAIIAVIFFTISKLLKEKKDYNQFERRYHSEDVDQQDQYSFIFYDSLGIGRVSASSEYDKFLSLPEDLRVSKVHCAIIRSGDKLYLRDEGSKNHTYLNGKQIHKPIVIQKEDVITVGETRLEVVKILRETR